MNILDSILAIILAVFVAGVTSFVAVGLYRWAMEYKKLRPLTAALCVIGLAAVIFGGFDVVTNYAAESAAEQKAVLAAAGYTMHTFGYPEMKVWYRLVETDGTAELRVMMYIGEVKRLFDIAEDILSRTEDGSKYKLADENECVVRKLNNLQNSFPLYEVEVVYEVKRK